MRKWVWILFAVWAAVVPAWTAAAQQAPGPRPDGYFLSPDASGVWQVWRLRSSADAAEQVSSAPASVIDFAVAPTGGSIAYTSAGQLWLHRLDGSAPVVLASLSNDPAAHPIFNLDGSQVAYADGGIWLVNSGGGEPNRVFVDPTPGRSTPDAYPFYQPQRFIGGNMLLVDIGVWEGDSVGLLDLQTGAMQELETGVHHDALPLGDGRLLLFGNGGVSGQANLQITPMTDLNQRETIVDLNALSPDKPLFVEQALLVEPNTVRVFGTTFENAPEYRPLAFAFTVDVAAKAVTSFETEFMPLPADGQTLLGPVTPDGTILSLLLNADNRPDAGAYGLMAGQPALQPVAADATAVPVSPAPAAAFQWGPVGSRG